MNGLPPALLQRFDAALDSLVADGLITIEGRLRA
jgi:hypothetical protein